MVRELQARNQELLGAQSESDAAKARYFELFDQAPAAYITASPEGLILEANLAAARLLGSDRAVLPAQPLSRFIHADDQPLLNCLGQPAGTPAPRDLELRIAHTDGPVVWVRFTANHGRDAQGGPVWRIVLADITERKRAQTALVESEQLLRESQTIAGLGSYVLDLDTGVWTSSDVLDRVFGIDKSYTRSVEGWIALIHPNDRAMMDAYFKNEVLGQRRTFDKQYRLRTPAGQAERWVHGLGRLEYDSQGRAVEMHGTILDITDRKRAEDELRASEKRMADITFSMADWVWEVDAQGAYTYSSLRGAELLGRSHDTILGKKPFDFMPPDEARRVAAIFAEIAAHKAPVKNLENWNLRQNGERICLLTNAVPILDEAGRLCGYRGVDQDITVRKQAEGVLRQSVLEKETLLKEIHHRVKNNLQVISSLLRLQSRKIDHPVTSAVLLDMQSRVMSMALIHEHLYQSEHFAAVDLAAYLKRLCQRLLAAMVAAPPLIALQMELAAVRLSIDQAIPCGLIVNELVSNAVKHAFPNGRRGVVRVELERIGGGPGLLLRVADDGAGFPAGFDLKEVSTLGLQLVTTLARQLGGTLRLTHDNGAVFEIVFNESPRA